MTGLFSYPKRKLRKLINEGEYEQAIEFGNNLEGKFSDDPDFLFIMGSMYYMLKDVKNTLHFYEKEGIFLEHFLMYIYQLNYFYFFSTP